MIFYEVIEDLGDGDCAIRRFKSPDEALLYMENNDEWCYHESNPHRVDTDNIKFVDEQVPSL